MNDIRKQITDKMIESINKGLPPWRKPWSGGENVGMPCNFLTGRRYNGINPLILTLVGMVDNMESKNWGTARSWTEHLGVHVKKGSKAAQITYFTLIPKKDRVTKQVEKNSKGEDVKIPLLRLYPVFNAEQMQPPTVQTLLDGRCAAKWPSFVATLLGTTGARSNVTSHEELMLLAKRYAKRLDENLSREQLAQIIHDGIAERHRQFLVSVETRNTEPDFKPAEKFVKATKAKVIHKGTRAAYRPSTDEIFMPSKRSFDSMGHYYETLFHELVHWSEKRIKRKENEGSYSFGELVAEIGACFLMMEVGVPMGETMLENSQSYVKHWLAGMEADPKFIFDASSQASKCVDFLLAFIGKANPEYHGEKPDPDHDADLNRAVA